jgi:hypothetical protein
VQAQAWSLCTITLMTVWCRSLQSGTASAYDCGGRGVEAKQPALPSQARQTVHQTAVQLLQNGHDAPKGCWNTVLDPWSWLLLDMTFIGPLRHRIAVHAVGLGAITWNMGNKLDESLVLPAGKTHGKR